MFLQRSRLAILQLPLPTSLDHPYAATTHRGTPALTSTLVAALVLLVALVRGSNGRVDLLLHLIGCGVGLLVARALSVAKHLLLRRLCVKERVTVSTMERLQGRIANVDNWCRPETDVVQRVELSQ